LIFSASFGVSRLSFVFRETEYLKNLKTFPHLASTPQSELRPIIDLSQFASGLSLSKLLRLILKHRIPPEGIITSRQGLARYGYTEASRDVIRTLAHPNTVNHKDTMRILGCSPEEFRLLVREGYLAQIAEPQRILDEVLVSASLGRAWNNLPPTISLPAGSGRF
jgi:hypothetical protein